VTVDVQLHKHTHTHTQQQQQQQNVGDIIGHVGGVAPFSYGHQGVSVHAQLHSNKHTAQIWRNDGCMMTVLHTQIQSSLQFSS
jgi:hypothetical protein